MAIIGVDIDQLTPTSDTSGTVWLIIRRNGVDYKITKADFNSGNVGAAIPLWNSSLIFNTTDNRFCVDPATNRFWRSKVDANQNNQPPQNPVTTEDDNWIEISPKESSAIKEWEPGWFFSDHVVVKRLGRLVELINPARPYDSVDIEAEIAGGDWRYIPIGAPTTGGAYQNTYASIPAMITGQGDQASGAVQFVADASADFPAAGQGDATVQSGWAEYIYLGTTNGDLTDYRKRAEQESMDVSAADLSDRRTFTAAAPSIASNQVTLNFDSKNEGEFRIATTITAALEVLISNTTNAVRAIIKGKITGTWGIDLTEFGTTVCKPEGDYWAYSAGVVTVEGDTATSFEISIEKQDTEWNIIPYVHR